MQKKFKWIGFDADDTLWINESYFRETEYSFCKLLVDYGDEKTLTEALYKKEIKNLELYGYGIKGFVLSMIETAIELSNGAVSQDVILQLISYGKGLLDKPVVLLDGIRQVLENLSQSGYKLIVATKGDLLDQERKLKKSKLEQYFHHIEIMSDKKEDNYEKLLAHLDIQPEEFLMVGNSLKSDILPVLNIGASAVHIPFHTTWIHEHVEVQHPLKNFWELEDVSGLEDILK
jgi:putative hydrolase of the HAD superfamily